MALVTTAGLVPPGAPPFDDRVRGGDWSYRTIAGDTDPATLEEHQRSESFDRAGITADRNLALPLDRLRELVAEGVIGEVAPRHLSFMARSRRRGGSSAGRRPKRPASSSTTTSIWR